MNETPNQLMQEIWQSQPTEGIKMSVEEIRQRAGKLERKVRMRNLREYIGALIAAAGLTYFFVRVHDVPVRIALAMLLAGLAYLAYQLHHRGSSNELPSAMGSTGWLQFYRGQLERQRDFLRGIWRWYLGPLIPGMVALSVAALIEHPHLHNLRNMFFSNAFTAVLCVLIWKLNQWAANCLQKQIDELYAAER